MMKFKKKIQITPAFDKRDPNPSKNYGIHGCNMLFTLIGKRGAVTFSLYTDWHLPHVKKELKYNGCNPMPADIGYHSPHEMYEGQQPRSSICEYIGVPCYQDGSTLCATEFFDTLVSEGLKGLWKKMITYYKERFNQNKEVILRKNKEYRDKHKNELEFIVRKKLNFYKQIDKIKNLENNIDYEFFIEVLEISEKKCHYCKKLCENNGNNQFTLDRKNNNFGHLKDNVVICCWMCNTCKGTKDYEEYKSYMEKHNLF